MADVLTEDFFTEDTITELLAANKQAADDVLAAFRDHYQDGREYYASPREDPCYNVLRTQKKTVVSSLELLQKHVGDIDCSDPKTSEQMQGYVSNLVQNWLNSCLLVTAPAYHQLFSQIGEDHVLEDEGELEVLQSTYHRVNTLLKAYYQARDKVFSRIPGLFSTKYMVGVQKQKLRQLSRGGDAARVETRKSRIMTDGFGFSPFWGLASTSTEHIGNVVGVSRPPAILLGDQTEMSWDSVVALCKDYDDGPHPDHHCFNTNTELWAAQADLRDVKQLAGRRVKRFADSDTS